MGVFVSRFRGGGGGFFFFNAAVKVILRVYKKNRIMTNIQEVENYEEIY